MQRDSFIFYRSFYEAINDLPEKSQLKVYKAICEMSLNFDEIDLSGLSLTIFKLIKPQLEANNKRYTNGSKGGAPKGNQNATKKQSKNNQKTTKKQPNNNVNENDNENVNDNINTSSSNNIYSYLEDNLGRTLNGAEIELATAWANEYDWEKIEYAIKETLIARANNLKYTDAILRNIKDKSNDELYSKTKEEDEEEIEMPDYDWLNESD
jgi:DnaD/phage-associated family protein